MQNGDQRQDVPQNKWLQIANHKHNMLYVIRNSSVAAVTPYAIGNLAMTSKDL